MIQWLATICKLYFYFHFPFPYRYCSRGPTRFQAYLHRNVNVRKSQNIVWLESIDCSQYNGKNGTAIGNDAMKCEKWITFRAYSKKIKGSAGWYNPCIHSHEKSIVFNQWCDQVPKHERRNGIPYSFNHFVPANGNYLNWKTENDKAKWRRKEQKKNNNNEKLKWFWMETFELHLFKFPKKKPLFGWMWHAFVQTVCTVS